MFDWYEVDLSESIQFDNYINASLEGRGDILLRFIKIFDKFAWVIDNQVISETYKYDYEQNYAFGKDASGSYFIGFKKEEV